MASLCSRSTNGSSDLWNGTRVSPGPPERLGRILARYWHEKPQTVTVQMNPSQINGRGEWIRTTGLLVPNQALYQAEPRPEC